MTFSLPLPEKFVWTKMGAESGELLDAIIRRKEYERQLGGGMFCWGIGNALGTAVDLLSRDCQTEVLFSPMLSKAKAIDAAPCNVLLWTRYLDPDGNEMPLPGTVLVTSRAHSNGPAASRHYALFCESAAPLTSVPERPTYLSSEELRNFSNGTRLGASQVTAVVRHTANPAFERRYAVRFRAKLARARYAKLAGAKVLTATDVALMVEASGAGIDAWRTVVSRLRRIHLG